MREDLGTRFEPYHREIYNESKKKLTEGLRKNVGPGHEIVRRKVTETATQIEDVLGEITDRIENKEKGKITGDVQKLARYFVEQGVRGRESLLDAVHNALREVMPDMTRRETMDAISGYGEYRSTSSCAKANAKCSKSPS